VVVTPVTATVAEALVVPPSPVQARVNVPGLVNAIVGSLPEVAFAPDHAPEALQEAALADDQVSVDDPPLATDVGFAASETVGTAGALWPVVKNQVKLAASALPAASAAAVVMVAVYWVLAARGTDGVNVAVLPLTFTVPATAVPPEVATTVKLAVFRVAFVIASENVADTGTFSATPVTAFAGEVTDTVGGVVSRTAAVVKVELKLAASALPAASFAAVLMVAVCSVIAARGAVGVKVAVLPLTVTMPATAAPPEPASVKLALVSVELVIGSENVADTAVFSATPVAPLAGDMPDTVGGVVSGAAAVVKVHTRFAARELPAAS
jgi:hypothetical protein